MMIDNMNRTLGIIGVGAFGAFCIKHLSPYFKIIAYDKNENFGTIELAASQDLVLLCMPVQQIDSVTLTIKDIVKKGSIIIDVCSVKKKPSEILLRNLPDYVNIIGTHPLFGPQSGKDGIEGLKIALCNIRCGDKLFSIFEQFLINKLKLKTIITTPEQHDLEMAYVQGLTHLISRIYLGMNVPNFEQTTVTYEHLKKMVDIVRYDSDDLFHAIECENPYVSEIKKNFFSIARDIEQKLKH